jgi:hypothetical protein
MKEKQEAYVYDKTRRYQVDAGTRCTMVTLDLPLDVHRAGAGRSREATAHETRKVYTAKAVDAAADMWWVKYGEPVPWSFVQIMVSHVTAQVSVEFRVENP